VFYVSVIIVRAFNSEFQVVKTSPSQFQTIAIRGMVIAPLGKRGKAAPEPAVEVAFVISHSLRP
jgi:hypothetical protein